jgi:hypothetical protein
MLRTIAISLMLLLTVGVMLPFANSAHGVRQSTEVSIRRHHRYHSRAWWRRYRARLRKKRAAAALAHRNAILGQPQNVPVTDVAVNPLANLPAVPTVDAYTSLPSAPANTALPSVSASATAPSLPAAPVRVSEVKAPKASEAKVSVRTSVKNPPILPGQMNLSVVALSRPNPVFLTAREESKLLGGTSISDLRRIVIDKMIVSGGWVTNDFVREVNGSRIFVVTARTPRDSRSPEKIWTFYFTEADGRIYGLTTDAPVDSAERMSTEAERFINKLHATPQTIQR